MVKVANAAIQEMEFPCQLGIKMSFLAEYPLCGRLAMFKGIFFRLCCEV